MNTFKTFWQNSPMVRTTFYLVIALIVLGFVLQWNMISRARTSQKSFEPHVEYTTDFYEITANIPDPRYPEAHAFVMDRLTTAQRDWVKGGELEQAQIQLAAEFPELADMRYALNIDFKEITSQKFGTTTIMVSAYEFTGGAHGNTQLATFTYQQDTLVALDTVIDFTGGNDIALSRLAAEKLRPILGDMANDEMLLSGLGLAYLRPDGTFDNEKCSCDGFLFSSNFNNFAITDEGIKVIFGQYQVAPYAAGMPETMFTWSELAPYIMDGFDVPLD
jgi:hypothetical protein